MFYLPLSLTQVRSSVIKTFYNFHAARRVEKSGVYHIKAHHQSITKKHYWYPNIYSQLTSAAFCSSAVGIVKSSSANAIVGDNTAVTEEIAVASDVLKKSDLSQDVDNVLCA